ncbi:MAG: hypothetical protein LDL42_02870 [Rhizobium sp.]|nr:hypothetical protein [Rhizobium sp.]
MTPERPSLWRRLGPAERAFAIVIVAMAIGGVLLIADGLYLKAKADQVPSLQTHQGPVSTDGAPRTD